MVRIGVATLVGGVFWFAGSLFFNEAQHAVLMGLVAFMVALWTNEGVPMGVTSLLPLFLFPAFKLVPLGEVATHYSNPIIFLFIGGFLLAIGMQKLDLHRVVAYKLLHFFPRTTTGMVYALVLSASSLSAMLSNTTVTLMLMPMALCLTEEPRLKVRFLLAVAYGASVGGIITPIGTPPNLIYLGTMERFGMEGISLVSWVFRMLPLALMMLLLMPQILLMGVRGRLISLPPIEVRMKRKQWLFIGLMLCLVALLFLQTTLVKGVPFLFWLNDKVILLGMGLSLFLPGIRILNWNEDVKKIPLAILFLFGAGFAIGDAFSSTGLASSASKLFEFFEHAPQFLVVVALAAIVSFSTEVTSNTAFTSITLPVLYVFTQEHSLDSEVFLMVATIASSYAFMLPIATPPNAIVMSSGVLPVKRMASFGFFINLLGILLLALVATFWWSSPFFKGS